MVEIVLTQLGRKESTHKSGLSAALRSDQSGHALIAMKRIHLQPMGHNGSNPRGQKGVVLRAKAWDSAEEVSHMVLAIPLREIAQKVLSGVEQRHFLRLDILRNLSLGTSLLQDLLLLSPDYDAVQSLWGKRSEGQFGIIRLG